jgi:ATP-dependent exoDNAse (exonuclease V) beta subunit
MEEERRLFYVTVTRAKRHLHLVYPIMSRSAASGQVINRPSIFLREVDEDLFETWQVNESPYGNKLAFKNVGAADHNEQTDTVYISEDEEYEQEQKQQKKGNILDIMRGI